MKEIMLKIKKKVLEHSLDLMEINTKDYESRDRCTEKENLLGKMEFLKKEFENKGKELNELTRTKTNLRHKILSERLC